MSGKVTATDFARHFKDTLNRVEFGREELIVVRNHVEIARVVPGLVTQTALEAMSDLYGVLDEAAAEGWLDDSRGGPGAGALDEARDPWAS